MTHGAGTSAAGSDVEADVFDEESDMPGRASNTTSISPVQAALLGPVGAIRVALMAVGALADRVSKAPEPSPFAPGWLTAPSGSDDT